jgi:hypothetical protein
MAPRNAISESTTATSRKFVFSQTNEKIAIEAITNVANKSNAVTLSGNDGPLINLIITSNMHSPIIKTETIIAMFSISNIVS